MSWKGLCGTDLNCLPLFPKKDLAFKVANLTHRSLNCVVALNRGGRIAIACSFYFTYALQNMPKQNDSEFMATGCVQEIPFLNSSGMRSL